MKRVLLFVGLIFLFFLIGYALFALISTQLPQDKVAPFLLNQTFSIVLLFVLFIANPVVLAFWVISKGKKESDENGEEILRNKPPLKMAIFGMIGLSVFVFTLFSLMDRVSLAPYSENSILPDEFSEYKVPEKEGIVSKTIDDKKYILDFGPDKSSINLYIDDSKRVENIIWPSLPINDKRLVDFWFDVKSEILYTIEGRGENIGGDQYEQVEAIIRVGDKVDIKSLYLGSPGIYAGSRIINYSDSSKTLVILTMGGDGCGGWGELWTLNFSGVKNTLHKLGMGCFEPSLPRYVGIFNQSVLLFNIEDIEDFQNAKVTRIFSLNPFTGNEVILINKPELPESVTYVTLTSEDTEKPMLILHGDREYKFDLVNKEFLEE